MFHHFHRYKSKVIFGFVVAQPQKPFVVMMIVLQARAKSRRHRQPLADVHGVVLFIVITSVSKCSSVGPIVLNHIYPQGKKSDSNPHHQRKLHASNQLPEQNKIKGLCKNCENRIRNDSESPGFQNSVAGQILLALIRHQAEIQRSPKTIVRKFIGISGMVGMFMMQAVAIDPGNRIHIDRERVVHDGDGFHEPFSIVERTVSASQMKNVSQKQAAKKPPKDKINSAYKHSNPRSQMIWGGVQTSQHVSKNDQIACDVVNFHDGSRWAYSNRNGSAFQITR